MTREEHYHKEILGENEEEEDKAETQKGETEELTDLAFEFDLVEEEVMGGHQEKEESKTQ